MCAGGPSVAEARAGTREGATPMWCTASLLTMSMSAEQAQYTATTMAVLSGCVGRGGRCQPLVRRSGRWPRAPR